ncbi:winged helix-turn-helix domain-containing protein [Marinospirillum perlucidum]|uniref:winged helix-turn-helix domain-containing protein n=1 Tax=Marinospirillum perlucidum TaxID=1982602 RepID=UPI000DF3C7EF|nr:winged helix-turn-helix domain-containing protein [Marinospirillum perlucidum]
MDYGYRLLVAASDADEFPLFWKRLVAKQMELEAVSQAAQLWERLDAREYDLLILSEGLQGEEFEEILYQACHHLQLPVLVLAESKITALTALEWRAEEVVWKNVGPYELELRICKCLERLAGQQEGAKEVNRQEVLFSGYTLKQRERQLLHPQGHEISLTRAEFDLLKILVQAQGEPLSKKQLSLTLGEDYQDTSPETVAVLIHRLRKKMGSKTAIQTLSGVGYRIQFTPASEMQKALAPLP